MSFMNTCEPITSKCSDREFLLAEITKRDQKISYLEEQMDWFKKKYAEEIQIFEDNFETSVKWGVVNYWS